jgi:hypothetical protein
VDGKGARRKLAFAATASVAVLALLGFAAFEFTGRVNHAAVSHMAASQTTASQTTGSPAASETAKAKKAKKAKAKATARTTRTAAIPASPRPSKTRNKTRKKPTPSRTPSASSSVLVPVSAAAFGPDGTADGDNPQNASLVLTDPAHGWTTQWYATAEFGALKTGTGLLLDMGHSVTITAVRITLSAQSGADLELRGGPTLDGLTTLADAADVGGSVGLPLSQSAYARYILLWFTRLPPDDAGTYQVTVQGITVYGEP